MEGITVPNSSPEDTRVIDAGTKSLLVDTVAARATEGATAETVFHCTERIPQRILTTLGEPARRRRLFAGAGSGQTPCLSAHQPLSSTESGAGPREDPVCGGPMLPVGSPNRRNLVALALLVVIAAVWGGSYVVVKDAVVRAPVMDFLAIRFLIATAALAAVRPKTLTRLNRAGFQHGALLGLALSVVYIAQTYGLRYTSASVSGFITGMFVVFTPVITGLVLRRRIGAVTWWAVTIAMLGLSLMSVRSFSVGLGELLTLVCALFLALHIVGLGEWSSRHDAHGLTVVQLGVVTIICFAFAAPGGIHLPSDIGFWTALVGMSVIATAAAYMMQTWAQARLPAAQAAVILTLEPVFACVLGVAFDGDALTFPIVLGASLMVGAMYLIEFRSIKVPSLNQRIRGSSP